MYLKRKVKSSIFWTVGETRKKEGRLGGWSARALSEHEDALAILWQSAIKKRSIEGQRTFSDNLAECRTTCPPIAEKCCAADLQAIGVQLVIGPETSGTCRTTSMMV